MLTRGLCAIRRGFTGRMRTVLAFPWGARPAGALSFALLLLVACSKDRSPGPDTTPPAAVTDLALVHTNETSATVTWTAPGDDGTEGQAASYDLRYSLTVLPAGWDSATAVEGLDIPRMGGEPETVTVSGLTRDRIYYVALQAFDDAGNESDLSNTVQAQTADPTPPGQVTDLRVSAVEMEAVTLQFTAPGDDGDEGTATTYEIRYGSTVVTEETWDGSTPFPVTQAPQPAGTTETIRVTGLTPEATLHFAMRAQDDGGQWSPVSNDVETTLLGDKTPPASITDLAASGTEPYALTLTWTAPGDDGGEGQASAYAVRYATAAITATTWAAATPVAVPLTPKPAGQREELTLTDLPGDKTLWFCVRAADEKGNQSSISKAAKGYVRRTPRTWVVRVDGSGDAPTVRAGIDSSAHGDVVLVGPGTYYENIDLKGRQIRLKGEMGPEATILDGSRGDNSVVTCNSRETLDTVIEGFTIAGGVGRGGCSRFAGGIYVRDSAIVIRDNIIRGNWVRSAAPCWGGDGGGIYVQNSPVPVVIERNLIEGNASDGNAGGISLLGPGIVQDNIIRGNWTGQGDGGGVYVGAFTGPIVVRRNLILGNTANDHGGGIYISNSNVPASMIEVTQNLIIGNVALGADGAADGSGGGCWMSGHGSYFHHNTIAFNRADKILGDFAPTGGVHLLNPASDTRVEHNLIYDNEDGGVSVFGMSGEVDRWTVTFSRNLIYGNGPEDIQAGTWDPRDTIEIILQENVFADPLFCVIGAESRGELAHGSPALTQAFGIIGAVDHGSCDPSSAAQAQSTTWEAIKATYSD